MLKRIVVIMLSSILISIDLAKAEFICHKQAIRLTRRNIVDFYSNGYYINKNVNLKGCSFPTDTNIFYKEFRDEDIYTIDAIANNLRPYQLRHNNLKLVDNYLEMENCILSNGPNSIGYLPYIPNGLKKCK